MRKEIYSEVFWTVTVGMLNPEDFLLIDNDPEKDQFAQQSGIAYRNNQLGGLVFEIW